MATANLDITLGLTPPTSVEIRVTAIPAIQFGLTAVGFGTLSRTASLGTTIGLTAKGGFSESAVQTINMGLSGTVGSFLDGHASLGMVMNIAADGRAVSSATLSTLLGLTGAPTISGGIVNSTANLGISFGLQAAERIGAFANLGMLLDLDATGSSHTLTAVTNMRLTFAAEEIRLFWRKS